MINMNAKKTNWLFTSIILINILAVLGIALLSQRFEMKLGAIPALLLSQAMLFVPAILFLLGTRTRMRDLIAVGKPKWITSFLTIAFTFLCMPLIVTVNAFSMLFVENEVNNLQPLLQGIPWWQLVLMIGIIGPVSEEFVFRGVIYHGYRRSGRLVAAMLMSAFLFGLMHLNFNQMSYAFLVGIIGVLLMEGTGSIFYPMLFHVCINMSNVVQILIQDPTQMAMDAQQTEQMIEATMGMPYKQAMCFVVAIYAIISCVTTAIAACIYYVILKREGRTQHFLLFFSKKGRENVADGSRKIVTWPLIVSVVICLVYMVADVIWL